MFDTVIVGSGYGGAVIAAAARRAAAGVAAGAWTSLAARRVPQRCAGSLSRLHESAQPDGCCGRCDLVREPETRFANAFGGSSVVNYGITARPEDHVFGSWPISAAEMRPYIDRAHDVLAPTPNPKADALGDKQFLDLMEPGRRVDLANTIELGQLRRLRTVCSGLQRRRQAIARHQLSGHGDARGCRGPSVYRGASHRPQPRRYVVGLSGRRGLTTHVSHTHEARRARCRHVGDTRHHLGVRALTFPWGSASDTG